MNSRFKFLPTLGSFLILTACAGGQVKEEKSESFRHAGVFSTQATHMMEVDGSYLSFVKKVSRHFEECYPGMVLKEKEDRAKSKAWLWMRNIPGETFNFGAFTATAPALTKNIVNLTFSEVDGKTLIKTRDSLGDLLVSETRRGDCPKSKIVRAGGMSAF